MVFTNLPYGKSRITNNGNLKFFSVYPIAQTLLLLGINSSVLECNFVTLPSFPYEIVAEIFESETQVPLKKKTFFHHNTCISQKCSHIIEWIIYFTFTFSSFSALIRLSLPLGLGTKTGPSSSESLALPELAWWSDR